jgi:hypothetical protein
MKKAKIALIMSASCLLALGMASCGGHDAVSSVLDSSVTVSSSTSQSPTVTKITAPNIPLVKVGAELDLDTVIIVTTSDGATTSKDYTVTCSNTAVTLTGHVFKSTAPGSMELVVKAGGKSIKPTVEVKTETGIELIDFFKTLDATPQNYTLTCMTVDKTTNSLVYDDLSFFHNEKYIAVYNAANPGEVGTDGTPNSTLLATLTDGKAYWGAFDSTGKPVFDAGAVNYSDYYISNDLSVDGNAFTSTLDDTGAETITAPTAVTTAFINFGFGRSGVTGYSIGDTEVVGTTDADNNGVIESVTLALYVTKDSKDYLFQIFTLENVGATTVAAMETAIKDSSYVPATITAPEVTKEFTDTATGGNYTTTISLYASDDQGAPIPTATVAATPANYNYASLFGTDGLGYRSTTTITSDGFFAKNESLSIATDVATATVSLVDEASYFNRDSKVYKVAYDSTKKVATTTEVTGVTDVWSVASAKSFKIDGVTEAGVNSTEWTKKTVSGTATTFVGKVGDNDGTTAANLLFKQMFDQLRFFAWGSASPETIGTYFTEASELSSGDKHALTLYSDWLSFTVDTTAKTIAAKALVYLPIGKVNGSAYMTMEYSISAVGTTTNDFSAFVPASTTTPTSSALA